jgi:hypothetical protein
LIGWKVLRGRRPVSLLTALAASAALLIAPLTDHGPPAPMQTVEQVWPKAKHAVLTADLADGTAYQPLLFFTATASAGTAPTKNGKSLRLLIRQANGSLRQLRSLPISHDPSIPAITVAGGLLVWVESTGDGHQELWSADLRGGAAGRLTADTGDARFYQSDDDLVVAGGRIHWVAAGPGDTTQVRSVALSGGAVDVRSEPGTWAFSAWPWLTNGVVNSAGATLFRNLATGQDRRIPVTDRGVTACSPTWCQIALLTRTGDTRLDFMHPDGSARRTIGGVEAATVISDVGELDRYEVYSNLTATSQLTGNVQLLIYEISTRRTAEVSPDAFSVFYRAGILSWSTGTQQSFIRHALDLRSL